MTDRAYPSAKPNGTTTTTPAVVAATLPTVAPPIPNPPAKANLYNPTRQPYRPTPAARHRQKHRQFSCRRYFCIACFWSILILIAILLLAAIVAAAFYVLYHPHRPAFSVASLKISSFNLTTHPSDDTTHLTTKINLTLSVKNNNKKIIFFYDPSSIRASSDSVLLSNGSFTNFTNSPGSVYIIHTVLRLDSAVQDADSVNSLKSSLKKKNGLPIEIVVDTMLGGKLEKLKMKKIGIRVSCDGVQAAVPKGKIVTPARTARAKCKVDLRIKILKWTF